MIKAVVKFWGHEKNGFGMPVPFHSYLVVASPWQTPNGAVASIVPISADAPMSSGHFPVQQGGERAAFDAAVAALKADPRNSNLTHSSHEDEPRKHN